MAIDNKLIDELLTKILGGFPNQEAALNLLFLALRQAAKKWTMPSHHWREALNHFTILWPNERRPWRGWCHEIAESFHIAGRGKGKLPFPSRIHPQNRNLVVYTKELTHLEPSSK